MSSKNMTPRRRDAKAHVQRGDANKIVAIRTEKRSNPWKTLAFVLLIAIQVAVILWLIFGYLTVLPYYLIASVILSLLCILHVFESDKEGQTKAIWIFILLIGFTIGFIIYLLSQESIFYGRQKKRFKDIYARAKTYTKAYVPTGEHSSNVSHDIAFLKNAGDIDGFENSSLEYFPSGGLFFDDMLEKVRGAKSYVFIEFFIIADGILFEEFFDVLSKKVKEGVDVRIIIDGIGSNSRLAHKSKKRMRDAGMKLYYFNRFIPWFTFALNLRDHRKIVVVDGEVAYAGGCNVSDEYINEKRMHGYWKDNGLRVTGDAVDGLTIEFLRQCEFCRKTPEDYEPFLHHSAPVKNDAAVVPWIDGKDLPNRMVKGLYSNIIAGAKERLYIMTPYLVPDDETMALLEEKALSGVDVRIIIPGVPDKNYVYRVTLARAERLRQKGAKIYVMRHSFIHSKVVYSEDCVSVGSANIDIRSYYNQFENGIYTDDPHFMEQVKADFDGTFLVCEDLKNIKPKHPFWNRLAASVLRFFSPLM